MKNKPTILIFGILVCLSLLVLLAFWIKNARERAIQQDCLSNLHAIGFCVRLYLADKDGKYPRNLQQVVDADNSIARAPFLLVCHGTGKLPGAVTNVAAWTDYTFIDWPAVLGTNAVPTNYPVAFDRSLSNHAGHGVCVLTADGLVRWDSNAEWLRKFSAEHPEAKLPMPQ